MRCVKANSLYTSKQSEHRRELEPRLSALALAIEGRAHADFGGLSTPLSQTTAPKRLRVAVDVDEGEQQACCHRC